jgi:hypothetical protein
MPGVEAWGAARYGDPCRECGFDWSLSFDASVDVVAAIPARYAALFSGRDASARHPDLDWTAGGYVCHVADNLRIWAERLAGAGLEGPAEVPGYDEKLLAQAREYNQVPVRGALCSLRSAAQDWAIAVALAAGENVVLRHANRGEQTVLDVARNNAHDAFHHGWDIARSLADADPADAPSDGVRA